MGLDLGGEALIAPVGELSTDGTHVIVALLDTEGKEHFCVVDPQVAQSLAAVTDPRTLPALQHAIQQRAIITVDGVVLDNDPPWINGTIEVQTRDIAVRPTQPSP